MKAINGFFNEFRFLSNFYPSKIFVDGIYYPTVEHAFQAQKTLNVEDRIEISRAETPSIAKKMGRQLTCRSDWEKIKIEVMEKCLREKFFIPTLKEALITTNDFYLEETNTWNDTFWGVCRGVGENHLGKILMKIRDELTNS